MAESELTVRITARDDATPAVEDAAKRMESAGARVRGAHDSVAASTREATQTFRAMSTGLLEQLNPALAGSVQQLSFAAREARHLTPTVGALTVGFAAASIVAGAFIVAMKEQAQSTVRLQEAVRAVDYSSLRSQTREVTRDFLIAQENARGFADRIRESSATLGPVMGSIQGSIQASAGLLLKLFDAFMVGLGLTETFNQKILELKVAASDIFPKMIAPDVQAQLMAELTARKQILDVQRAQVAQQGDTETVKRRTEEIATILVRIAQAQQAVINTGIQARITTEEAVFPPGEAPVAIRNELERLRKAMLDVSGAQFRAAESAEAAAGRKLALDTEINRLTVLKQILETEEQLDRAQRQRGTSTSTRADSEERAQEIQEIDELIVKLVALKNAREGQLAGLKAQAEAAKRQGESIDFDVARANIIRQIVMLGGQYQKTVTATGEAQQFSAEVLTRRSLPALDALIVAETKRKDLLAGQLLELQLQNEAHARLAARIDLTSQLQQTNLERQKIGADAALQARVELDQIESRRANTLATISAVDPNADLKRQLAGEQAALERSRVLFEEAGRTRPDVGFRRGLAEMIEDFESTGRSMATIARTTATSMQQAFSEQLFDVVTGKFEDLAAAGQRFGQAVLRSITDALAKAATAPFLRALGQVTGQTGGTGSGLLSMLGLTAGGGLAAGASGVSDATLFAQAMALENTVAGGGTSGFSFGNVASSLPSAVTFAGGGLREFLASPIFQQSYSATGALQGGGPTVGQAIGVAGGAFGLGLTVFSALQGPPTTQNIVGSAVSGGISGLMLGSAFGPWGALIGFLAGAILGAGAGALGKGPDLEAQAKVDRNKKAVADAIFQELSAALNATLDPEEIARTRVGAAGGVITIGGFLLGLVTAVGSGVSLRNAGPAPGSASGKYQPLVDALSGLGYRPEDFSILAPGGPSQRRRREIRMVVWIDLVGWSAVTQILDAALQRLQQVQELLARSPFSFTTALGKEGEVERRTFLRASKFGLAEGAGQQLSVSMDLLRLLLGDDNAVELILRRLRRVDRDRNLGLIDLEEFSS